VEIRLSGHGAYCTEYHIVSANSGPKYHRRYLNPGVKTYSSKLFPNLINGSLCCQIIQQSIMIDHIYLVISDSTKVCSKQRNWAFEAIYSKSTELKVCMAW
jgi:REP element-mobilizing transposase RayT